MKIRAKIVLVVLPLIITTLLLAGISSFFSATTGITRLARDFLDFKAGEVRKRAEGQWRLLVDNDLTDRQDYVDVAKQAVEDYAGSIAGSPTEITIALDENADLAMSTRPVEILPEEREALLRVIEEQEPRLRDIRLGGVDRVAKGFLFGPFGWYVMVTEERETFFAEVTQITRQTLIILAASSILGIVLLLVFAGYLTGPLTRVIDSMRVIRSTSDLSQRVQVEFDDETGILARNFNDMVQALDKSQSATKKYAFDAVMSQRRETKIRNIFQKYVPADVIDTFFENPDRMLVGDNRVVAILFSDIRSFTTISEGFAPDELVNTLNRYFSIMVEIIMNRDGIVDKYIGDAIMGIFGAIKKRDNDALQSVLAGIEMTEALGEFNADLRERGLKEWNIGVGLNYGVVTVGNIGTEKKMDYTVIGDMVNLGSRMEGLTKYYKTPLLFTESVHRKVSEHVPCRLIDAVMVKGKTVGERIYTAKKSVNDDERRAWAIHETAMTHYFNREFRNARSLFAEVGRILPDDYPSQHLAERCERLEVEPPPPDWDFTMEMAEK